MKKAMMTPMVEVLYVCIVLICIYVVLFDLSAFECRVVVMLMVRSLVLLITIPDSTFQLARTQYASVREELVFEDRVAVEKNE